MDKKSVIAVITLAIFATPSMAQDATDKADSENFKAMDAKFIKPEERVGWLDNMRSTLPIAKRDKGPFGLAQDASAIVAVKKAAPKRSDAFAKAINSMNITALLPGDNKFVIGSHEYFEGQVFPVILASRQFNVKILSVKIDKVLFKNMITGEKVTKNMNTLPQGMTPNGSIESVEGVTRMGRGKPAPLNLDR